MTTPVLSLDDLITAKQAAGRRKDRMQVRQLLIARLRRPTRPRNA